MAATIDNSGLTFGNGTKQVSAPSSSADYGQLISITTFTSNGTYTAPANCRRVLVKVQGGGGGSAGHCEGGGAGGYSERLIHNITPGTTVAVTIGGGGGGVGYYAAAGRGGTSSFGSLISATGGYGANNNQGHGGGHGGSGSGGQIQLDGGTGAGHGNSASNGQPAGGGPSFFGGPGGQYRSTTPSNYSPALGSGATGGRTNDGGSGTGAPGGVCVVYAYT